MQFGTNVWRNLFCTNPVISISPDVTIWTTRPRLQAYLLLLVSYLCILWEKYSETDHQTEIYIADVARTVGHIVLPHI